MEESITIPLSFFDCCVCYKTAYSPIAGACPHVICTDCFVRLEFKKCPLCRIPLPNVKNEMVEHMFIRFYGKAECRNEGCDFKGTCADLSKHGKECPHKLVSCDRCNLKMKADYFKTKHQEVCNFRVINCEQCGDSIEAGDLSNHLSLQCRQRSIECKHCNESIKAEDLSTHMNLHCRRRLIECKHCGVKMGPHMLKKHMRKVTAALKHRLPTKNIIATHSAKGNIDFKEPIINFNERDKSIAEGLIMTGFFKIVTGEEEIESNEENTPTTDNKHPSSTVENTDVKSPITTTKEILQTRRQKINATPKSYPSSAECYKCQKEMNEYNQKSCAKDCGVYYCANCRVLFKFKKYWQEHIKKKQCGITMESPYLV